MREGFKAERQTRRPFPKPSTFTPPGIRCAHLESLVWPDDADLDVGATQLPLEAFLERQQRRVHRVLNAHLQGGEEMSGGTRKSVRAVVADVVMQMTRTGGTLSSTLDVASKTIAP